MGKCYVLAVFALIVAIAFSLIPSVSMAQQCIPSHPLPVITLRVWEQGLRVIERRADIKAKLIASANCAAFKLKLRPRGVTLRDGQVILRMAASKTVDGELVSCASNLKFSPRYSNTGWQTEIVTIVPDTASGVIDVNDYICFDILVEDVGVIDPRARVVDEATLLNGLAEILKPAIELYDMLLANKDNKINESLDSFLQETFDISEEDARELVGMKAGE